jgi:predicted nucleotidyltransferase
MNKVLFESKYVTNEIRASIYDEFLIYLTTIKQYLSTYTLIIFGSFVTNKKDPNDIDLLLHGYVNDFMLSSFKIEKLQSHGMIHVKLEISAKKNDFKLRNNQELIRWFESLNPEKKVDKYETIEF